MYRHTLSQLLLGQDQINNTYKGYAILIYINIEGL